jgi:hypothetical protein
MTGRYNSGNKTDDNGKLQKVKRNRVALDVKREGLSLDIRRLS